MGHCVERSGEIYRETSNRERYYGRLRVCTREEDSQAQRREKNKHIRYRSVLENRLKKAEETETRKLMEGLHCGAARRILRIEEQIKASSNGWDGLSSATLERYLYFLNFMSKVADQPDRAS